MHSELRSTTKSVVAAVSVHTKLVHGAAEGAQPVSECYLRLVAAVFIVHSVFDSVASRVIFSII